MPILENIATDHPAGRYCVTDGFAVVPQFYASHAFVFKNNKTPGHDFMPNQLLEKSLEKVSELFYLPMTGWFENDNGNVSLVWDGKAKSGLSFSACTIDSDYKTLRSMARNQNPVLFDSPPNACLTIDNKTRPLLMAKATRLASDDAVAIGVLFHHSLMDGASIMVFMNNWAAVCKQMNEGVTIGFSVPYPPSFGFPELEKGTNVEQITDDYKFCSFPFKHYIHALKNPDIVEHRLVLSKKQESEMRQKAHDAGLSFNDILCAVMLKGLASARFKQMPDRSSKNCVFSCAVNLRRRIGISDYTCGNIAQAANALIPVEELAKLDILDVAKIVHKTVASMNYDFICTLRDYCRAQWLESFTKDNANGENLGHSVSLLDKEFSNMIFFTSALNFPIYDIDFGFGRLSYARPTFGSIDGAMTLWPASPDSFDDAIEIYVQTPKDLDIGKSSILKDYVRNDDY